MAEQLKADIEAAIKSVLGNGKDYGIGVSDNAILREFVHVAVDMIED